ncbi:hypothetical protein DL766_000845 [Monosporascus sp. MC13-8B]|uniref:Uncharacterized protein n=1 Tax=Monosporascus cannonballus TaxID=155416 RepID=A0ABY0H189_9PEZI|nr:hypothetical protein DL762_007027 [Monosporascus cannonballus]RYO94119.1 hypothetical protein DL763_004187 [Monosporascus cannonballus]RYP38635.1 hypothetical protein DL766_000845 [Monosporascus sp. MC13-8B]
MKTADHDTRPQSSATPTTSAAPPVTPAAQILGAGPLPAGYTNPGHSTAVSLYLCPLKSLHRIQEGVTPFDDSTASPHRNPSSPRNGKERKVEIRAKA